MHLNKFLFLLLSLLFLISFFANGRSLAGANANANAPDLITETCKHTLYSDICMSTLRSSPRSTSADLQGLVEISIEACSVYARETAAYMMRLKYEARRANETERWHSLRDCLAGYDEGVDELEQAAEALRRRGYDTVNMMVAGAMTNADTCQTGIEESRWRESPVTDRNRYLMKMCSNSMAIAKLLG